MEYLTRVLGIQPIYIKEELPISLPGYLHTKYDLRFVMLQNVKTVFVTPEDSLDSIDAIKKHLARIEMETNAIPVLSLSQLTYRQKEYLLRDHIPFIVDGKQIYLPFLAVYLQERCNREPVVYDSILPSAQLLLLHFIYHGCKEMTASSATRALGFTPTSISRASKQLESMGLLQTRKQGVEKILFSNDSPQNLFEKAKNHLINPIKRTIYVVKQELSNGMLLSSYSALSEYSMLNSPAVTNYATNSISKWDSSMSLGLYNTNEQCAVELWRYDPRKLANGNCVDPLSLVLALQNDSDERTEESIEELLAQVWEDIDGTRNRKF